MPDLDRAGLTLEQSRLRLAHANKTLIVSVGRMRHECRVVRLMSDWPFVT